jgi:hypothetical protein
VDTELREQVKRLTDRAEIYDCMQRYARGMDRRDRALLRSAYHDGAVDDHVGFVGVVDDFIDWALAYHSTQTRHQHYLLNHTVDIDGDMAHAETYYLFVGTDHEPANHMTISGGRYVDRLERRDGRWAIADRVCVVEFITEVAAHRGHHRDDGWDANRPARREGSLLRPAVDRVALQIGA